MKKIINKTELFPLLLKKVNYSDHFCVGTDKKSCNYLMSMDQEEHKIPFCCLFLQFQGLTDKGKILRTVTCRQVFHKRRKAMM